MFKLALTLGKSIAEIERLDSREIAEWVAYFNNEMHDDNIRRMEVNAQVLQARAKAKLRG